MFSVDGVVYQCEGIAGTCLPGLSVTATDTTAVIPGLVLPMLFLSESNRQPLGRIKTLVQWQVPRPIVQGGSAGDGGS